MGEEMSLCFVGLVVNPTGQQITKTEIPMFADLTL